MCSLPVSLFGASFSTERLVYILVSMCGIATRLLVLRMNTVKTNRPKAVLQRHKHIVACMQVEELQKDEIRIGSCRFAREGFHQEPAREVGFVCTF